MTDERPVPGSDLEDRDALIERLADIIWDAADAVHEPPAGCFWHGGCTRAAEAVLALLESRGWGPVEAQDAVIARQAAALTALSQDPGGDLVSRRDIEARHEAVTNQLRAALARSRAEAERLQGLLVSACADLTDAGRTELAATLRRQGGIPEGTDG